MWSTLSRCRASIAPGPRQFSIHLKKMSLDIISQAFTIGLCTCAREFGGACHQSIVLRCAGARAHLALKRVAFIITAELCYLLMIHSTLIHNQVSHPTWSSPPIDCEYLVCTIDSRGTRLFPIYQSRRGFNGRIDFKVANYLHSALAKHAVLCPPRPSLHPPPACPI